MERNAQQPQVVVGVFDSRARAEAALADLEGGGFSRADVGLAARNARGEWSEFERGSATAGETKAEQGAVAGAAAGAGVGGLWALGIAAGMLPAIGPIVAGGILGSILASAATGAAAGGLTGALIGLGIPEEEARVYEREVSGGGVLLTVRSGSRFAEAWRILESHGAYDVRTVGTSS